MMKKRWKFCPVLVVACLVAMPVYALGPPYYATIIEDISFGTFALRNNNAQYTIVLAPDNTAVYSPEIISGTEPQRGEYFIEEFPINTALDITVTDGVLSDGAGQAFSVTDFTHDPLMTSPTGTATINLGATLRTSGTGIRYDSGNYSGTVDLTVIF